MFLQPESCSRISNLMITELFYSHIENVSKKIACAIGAIKRIRHLTPFNVLIKVYNSLV